MFSFAHGLSPQRLESPSGSTTIAYKFTATNAYKESQLFEVECFKENFQNPAKCEAMPGEFWMAPKRNRYIKVQVETDGDGVYLVCTKQVPKDDSGSSVITRVCARWGVGVSPANVPQKNSNSKKVKK